MKQDKLHSILERPGHPDGMTVPEGFFEDFVNKMSASLPENELEKQPAIQLQAPTLWQRIRPFAYMAAMFAGVWCMMKMFSMTGNGNTDLSFDRNPVLTAALANEEFVNDFVVTEYSEDQILEDMYANGVDIASLDF